jgi:hypothetical protein
MPPFGNRSPAAMLWESPTSLYSPQLCFVELRCGRPRRFKRCPAPFEAIFDSHQYHKKDRVHNSVFFMVPGEGIEPSIPYGRGILSPQRIPVPPPRPVWRCERESNPRIEVLQTPALPLRHRTIYGSPIPFGPGSTFASANLMLAH